MEEKGENQEQMESDDLDLLWCIDCMKCHGPECPLQQQGTRPVLIISDTPTISRAVASLPGILNLCNIGDNRQVVANENIARKTVFGPLEAPEVGCDEEEEGLVLKIFKKNGVLVKLDTSDEQRCNWMTLVTPATTAANQNLIVYQYQGALYFTVTRDIEIEEVLHVWYAPNYAEKLGKSLFPDTLTTSTADLTSIFTEASPSAETSLPAKTSMPDASSAIAPTSGPDEPHKEVDVIISSESADQESSASITPEKKSGGSTSSTAQKAQRKIATRSTTRKDSPQEEEEQRTSTAEESAKSPTTRSKSLKRGSSATEEDSAKANSSSVGNKAMSSVIEVTKVGNKRQIYVVRGSSNQKGRGQIQATGRARPQLPWPSKDDANHEPQSDKTFQMWKRRLGKYYQLVPKRNLEVRRGHMSKQVKRGIVAKPPKRDRKNSHLPEAEYKQIEERIWDEVQRSCCNCTLVFDDADKLAEHVRTEHAQEPVLCPECKKVCLTTEQLSEHVAVIHPDSQDVTSNKDPSKYRCPLCDKKLLHLKTFRNHLEFFHGKTFSCPTCGGKFWNRSKYLQHIGEHKLQGEQVEASEMYTCNKCNREFTCLSGLSIHKAFAHKKKAFSCSYCNYSTRYELTLQEHILFTHPENDLGIPESQKLTCEICFAVFLRNRTLKQHMQNHKKREFKCEKCDTVYRRKENLERHSCLTARRRTVTLDMIETESQSTSTCDMFECQRCQKLFASYAAMKHHAQTHQDIHYTCNVCHKEFHKRFDFDSHKYQHLRIATKEDGSRELIQMTEGPVNRHACHLCDCHFTKMNPLIQHFETHHKSAVLDVQTCIPCQRLFLSHEELLAHIANHTRITMPEGVPLDDLHSCPVCGRVFKALGQLEKHMTIHTGDKTHVCENCGKSFRRADQLKSHRLARHDQNSKKTLYKCNICNKSFKSNCLRLHIQWHAGQRDYQCPHCNRTFTQRGNFNRHVILHTKKKEIKCQTCDRTFKHEEYMERHQLVHQSYEYICSICNGKFSTQHFLDNHIKKVHEASEACQCEYCGMKFKYLQSYRNHMNRKHPDVARTNYQPVSEFTGGLTSLEVIVSSLISSENQEA